MLYNNIFENDFNAIIADTKIEADQIYGCIYSDIDNERQNLMLKLLFAINNIKLKTISIQELRF